MTSWWATFVTRKVWSADPVKIRLWCQSIQVTGLVCPPRSWTGLLESVENTSPPVRAPTAKYRPAKSEWKKVPLEFEIRFFFFLLPFMLFLLPSFLDFSLALPVVLALPLASSLPLPLSYSKLFSIPLSGSSATSKADLASGGSACEAYS